MTAGKWVEITITLPFDDINDLDCVLGDLGMYDDMTGDCSREEHYCLSKELKLSIASMFERLGYSTGWLNKKHYQQKLTKGVMKWKVTTIVES